MLAAFHQRISRRHEEAQPNNSTSQPILLAIVKSKRQVKKGSDSIFTESEPLIYTYF